MPRQSFKSDRTQSRCTVPAWSWWDLRTGFLKGASELPVQPWHRFLKRQWWRAEVSWPVVPAPGASLGHRWLHQHLRPGKRGRGSYSSALGTKGPGCLPQVLCWCKRRQWQQRSQGWCCWHQITSCLMHSNVFVVYSCYEEKYQELKTSCLGRRFQHLQI